MSMRDVRETAGMRGPRKHCGSNRWIRECHGASVTVTRKPSCRGRNSTRAVWWACILCSFCISPASRTGRAPRCTTNHHNKDVVRDRTAARGWAVAGPLFAMLEVVACVWPCGRVSCVPLALLLRRKADTQPTMVWWRHGTTRLLSRTAAAAAAAAAETAGNSSRQGLPKAVVLTGPTAVGKTELSIRLARILNAEIISADSVQVRGHAPLSCGGFQ